jgi:hypothetical protein
VHPLVVDLMYLSRTFGLDLRAAVRRLITPFSRDTVTCDTRGLAILSQ